MRRHLASAIPLLAAAASLACVGLGCAYTPPRFVDAPPVVAVADHEPIPRPRARLVLAPFDLADAYVRQNLTYALDPADAELALDVNALDEVVVSSWWNPPADPKRPLDGYRRVGPPELPLSLVIGPIPSKRSGVRVRDARGVDYVVLSDPKDRPGLYSSAGVVASRLLFALGWRVPEAHAIRQENGQPALAIQWSVGVDLGPTPPFRGRFDDPNDIIARKDRRSLRALPRVFAWLAKRDLDVGDLRDSYVGEEGRGFVVHWIMGLEGALGVDALEDVLEMAADPDRPADSAGERFITLGLGDPNPIGAPDTGSPGLGLWGPLLALDAFDPSPPFEPYRYVTSADDVWIGKRLAALPRVVLEDAVRATPLGDAERAVVLARLDERRRAIAAWCLAQGTPLDPVSVDRAPTGELRVRLVDRAVEGHLADIAGTTWATTLYDGDGDAVTGAVGARRDPTGLTIEVPPAALEGRDYLVVRVVGKRVGDPRTRPMEVHLALGGGKPARVVGVVH